MITQSKEKIEKAKELLSLIVARRDMEKKEAELKDYFKAEITDGVLEAGKVIITLETKTRTSLDKKAMEEALGKDTVARFEKMTQYQQVNVQERRV